MEVAKSHTGPPNQLESISDVAYYSGPLPVHQPIASFELEGGNPQRKREKNNNRSKTIEIESKSNKGVG